MEAGRRHLDEDYRDGSGHRISRCRCFTGGESFAGGLAHVKSADDTQEFTGGESFASGLANSEESAHTQEFTGCDGDSLNQEKAYWRNAPCWGSWALPLIRLANSVPIPQMVW